MCTIALVFDFGELLDYFWGAFLAMLHLLSINTPLTFHDFAQGICRHHGGIIAQDFLLVLLSLPSVAC